MREVDDMTTRNVSNAERFAADINMGNTHKHLPHVISYAVRTSQAEG